MSFDDPSLVANAGLLPVTTLVLERLVNATVRLSGRVGGSRPGRKVLILVHAIVAGAPATSTTPTCCAPAAHNGSCRSG